VSKKPGLYAAFAAALGRLDGAANRFVLAAVSGGADSVVMLHLLHTHGVKCAVAHVNYKLRGEESDGDAEFVRSLAAEYDMPFYLHECGSHELHGSLQSTAREIRYTFFQRIARQNGCTSIATAHHFNDSAETLLLQLARGTGIDGAAGIRDKQGNVIRPLLQFTREEIEQYASEHQLAWRTDSSNLTDNYTRNRIRHHVLPELLNAVPQGREGLQHSLHLLGETQQLIAHAAHTFAQAHTRTHDNHYYISTEALLQQPAPALILHHLLKNHGVPGWATAPAVQLLHTETGTQFYAAHYIFTRNRTEIAVSLTEIPEPATYSLQPENLPAFFKTENVSHENPFSNNPWQIALDAEKLQWPLTLRPWQTGENMQPLGMKNRKNISDILTDAHWPSHLRKRTMVVLSGEEIIWIPGCRMSEKVRITTDTTTAIQFTFDPEYYA
jgi:tRNA(Ile)-lysidine synthase